MFHIHCNNVPKKLWVMELISLMGIWNKHGSLITECQSLIDIYSNKSLTHVTDLYYSPIPSYD